MHVDSEWVAGLRRGDPAAYETLVDRFESPLYRYFLAAHGDPQLAGEQSADCFGDLVQALPKMTGGTEQLRPFVFAVARNIMRRSWRTSKVHHMPLEAASDTIDSGPSPEEIVEYREGLIRFLRALRTLDDATRDVFVLHVVEELSLSDVARLVNEPLGTVKSRLHRGRHKLDELLKETQKL